MEETVKVGDELLDKLSLYANRYRLIGIVDDRYILKSINAIYNDHYTEISININELNKRFVRHGKENS